MTLPKRFDRQMLSMTGWVGEAIVSAATIIITTARLVAPLLGSLGLDGAPYALESLARPPTPLVHQALVRSQLIGSGGRHSVAWQLRPATVSSPPVDNSGTERYALSVWEMEGAK